MKSIILYITYGSWNRWREPGEPRAPEVQSQHFKVLSKNPLGKPICSTRH